MHRFLLFVGMGTALLAANACVARALRPLAAAAARNDGTAVRHLLSEGIAADDVDESGWTPLMWAARTGAIDAATALLDAGAKPNARDGQNGWTALQHAIHTHQVAAVQLLLDRGADPNAKLHPEALTPLLMAAGDRDPAIVKLLLAHGADPRHQGEWGDTPLVRAVSGGALMDIDRPLLGGCHLETVRALLAHDPSLELPETAAGRRALWWARFNECDDVLTLVSRIDRKAER